jgi:hypothetical protein
MSLKHSCAVHIINLLVKQIATERAAYKSIQQFSDLLCWLLFVRQNQHQANQLANQLIAISQTVGEAYEVLDESNTGLRNQLEVSWNTAWSEHISDDILYRILQISWL